MNRFACFKHIIKRLLRYRTSTGYITIRCTNVYRFCIFYIILFNS
nr:MAG TPA: hypothetical protein [Caudoviricetes sp.]